MGYNTLPKNPWPMSSDQASGGMTELPIAGADTLGGVKVGDGLSINAETGVLSNDNATPYELPEATPETLGGVMVGDGLKATVGVLDVNVAQDGNLSFNQDGELMADNWTPPAFTSNESESGLHLGDSVVYQKILNFDNAVSLPSNSWVDLGVIVNAETCLFAIAISSDGTSVPVCLANDSTVGIQVLNMRNTTVSFNKFLVFYTKATT